MHRLIRFALVWLLALALPVQGVAAVARLHCAPAAPATQHAHGPMQHGHAHDHAHSLASDTADAQAALPDVATACSACAACCSGAAMPAAGLSLQTGAASQAVEPAPPPQRTAFVTPGPDRPPRADLA